MHVEVEGFDHSRVVTHVGLKKIFGSRFGHEVDEDTFAWNTRAALDYPRQVLEHIANIAKKLGIFYPVATDCFWVRKILIEGLRWDNSQQARSLQAQVGEGEPKCKVQSSFLSRVSTGGHVT